MAKEKVPAGTFTWNLKFFPCGRSLLKIPIKAPWSFSSGRAQVWTTRHRHCILGGSIPWLVPWHDIFQALELLQRMEFTDVISYSGSISACDACHGGWCGMFSASSGDVPMKTRETSNFTRNNEEIMGCNGDLMKYTTDSTIYCCCLKIGYMAN